MTSEDTNGAPGGEGGRTTPATTAHNLDQLERILAHAETFAGLVVNGSYPVLTKHIGGAQRASLAIEAACVVHLADTLREHTAAIREQTEVIRKAR